MPRITRAPITVLSGLALFTLFALAPGCSSAPSADKEPVHVGLDQFLGAGSSPQASGAETPADPGALSNDQIRDWLAQDATVLPSLAHGATPESPVIATPTPASANPAPTVEIKPGATATDSADALASHNANADAPAPAVAEIESPADRRTRLARELADALRAGVRESSTPLREYAALSALELITPGVAPDPAAIPALTPREVDLLGAWRDLFRTADTQLASDPGDVSGLATAVETLAEKMSDWQTLDIARAVLCSRVTGFGQYTPLPGARFLAGRKNAAIVYVEAEHFTHSATTDEAGEPGYAVDLTQELSLYHDVDGLLAWRQPAQVIHDVSRRPRRDFFIVQRVDLPETLSVGSYRLKITLREASTGTVAERTIPIEFVADAALVRAP